MPLTTQVTESEDKTLDKRFGIKPEWRRRAEHVIEDVKLIINDCHENSHQDILWSDTYTFGRIRGDADLSKWHCKEK